MNPIAKFMKSAFKMESNEIRTVLLSFLFVFTLMTAYYILRPIREGMASDWSDAERTMLFWFTFVGSVIAVSLYGFLFTRVRFSLFVPVMYSFFALSFLGFYFAMSGENTPDVVNKSYFVWLSIFALFHLSIFWSFMADTFSKNQAPRLFGFIAAGSSAGAIMGPGIALSLQSVVGTNNLMLISVILLLTPIVLIGMIDRLKHTDLHNEDVHVDTSTVSTNPFSGFILFFKNPYLLGIGIFILLYTAISTFVWFQLQNLMGDEAVMADFREKVSFLGAMVDDDARGFRNQIWASMDLIVNTLGILTATLATSRMALKFGLPFTLAIVPVIIVAGLLVVAIAPFLLVVIILQIVRRAGNYAITRPGREMLFTVVDKESRFKAKSVIDVVVYRGGDALTAEAYTALSSAGIAMGPIAFIGAIVATVWAMVALMLGRSYDRSNEQAQPVPAE